MTRKMLSLLALGVSLGAGPAAQASSDEAWRAFRKDVADRCLAAGRAQGLAAARVFVHPEGSANYGVAVLEAGGDKRICIYVKQTRQVELTPAT